MIFLSTFQGVIQWQEVPVSAKSTEVLVDALDTYLFGVAVNALTWTGETISSGLQWNSCIYMKNISKWLIPLEFTS